MTLAELDAILAAQAAADDKRIGRGWLDRGRGVDAPRSRSQAS